MKKLEKKVAVITGGNSGIGKAIAMAYAKEGAQVVIFGRRASALKEAVEEIGHNASYFAGDVTNLENLESLYSFVDQEYGRLDIVVANAGSASISPIPMVTEAIFDKDLNVNLKGTFFTVQKALPYLKEGGSIVVVSTIAAKGGFSGMAVYSSAKGGLDTFVKTAAMELAANKIRINAISPGHTKTPAFDKMGLPDGQKEQMFQFLPTIIPLGRMGEPEDLKGAAVFLASEDSQYVTGTDLVVDGGAIIPTVR